MQKYELTIVLDGKATTAKQKAVKETIEKIVKILNGKIGAVEDWGEKQLAYKIGKSTTGIFIHFPLELETEFTKDLSTKLTMEGEIIRYLLIRKEK
jgi:small subunit ribosomal protein S6